MTWNERLGDLLADARRHRQMTQELAADRVHVNVSALANYERGRRRIHSDTLDALARLYGVAYSDLIPATVAADG